MSHVQVSDWAVCTRVGLTRRTKFPIKAIATLRALAANISPIPVPKTVVAPEPRKQHESSKKIRLTVNAAAA